MTIFERTLTYRPANPSIVLLSSQDDVHPVWHSQPRIDWRALRLGHVHSGEETRSCEPVVHQGVIPVGSRSTRKLGGCGASDQKFSGKKSWSLVRDDSWRQQPYCPTPARSRQRLPPLPCRPHLLGAFKNCPSRPYAGEAIIIASNLSVARLNFFFRRCTMPTGRANPGAFNFTATRRPCSISACMVRAGRMLIPCPSATAQNYALSRGSGAA